MGQSQNSAEAMRQGTAAAVGAFQNPNFGLSQAQRIGSLTGLPLPDYGQYGDPRTLETGANIGGIFNQLEQAGGRAALSPSAQSLYDDLRNYQVVLQERKNTEALERLGLPADVVRPDPVPFYSPGYAKHSGTALREHGRRSASQAGNVAIAGRGVPSECREIGER